LAAKALIYTHGDLDGVASAAVYIYLLRKAEKDAEFSVNFAEPSTLSSVLSSTLPQQTEGLRIAVMDLGLNPNTREEIFRIVEDLGKRATVEWYDHHIWSDDEVRRMIKAGVSLFIDRDKCATGVVAEHAFGGLEPGDNLWILVSSVCSSDLWKWDEPLSPLYYRAFGRREKRMKREALELFSNGAIWSDDFSDAVEEYLNLELKGYSKALKRARKLRIGGLEVAFAVKPKGPPNSSLLASHIMSRLGADAAIIIREDGALSLRSRGADVNRIARCLGGGGHMQASGAMLSLPLRLRLLRLIIPPLYRILLERYAASEVSSCFSAVKEQES